MAVIAAILPVSFDCGFSMNASFLLSTLVHLCLGLRLLLVYRHALLASDHFTLCMRVKTDVMPEGGIVPMCVCVKVSREQRVRTENCFKN